MDKTRNSGNFGGCVNGTTYDPSLFLGLDQNYNKVYVNGTIYNPSYVD